MSFVASLPSIIILLLLLPLIPTAYAGLIGAPYMPTRLAPVRKAFEQFGVGQDDVLIDIGAGDGKILLHAAERGAKAVGYELSPIMWWVAWWRTRNNPRIHVRYKNFFKATLPPETTVIFTFLMPEKMPNVRRFLRAQSLPQGKLFMSYMFPFKDVVPLRIVQAPNCGPVYVYDLKDVMNLDR